MLTIRLAVAHDLYNPHTKRIKRSYLILNVRYLYLFMPIVRLCDIAYQSAETRRAVSSTARVIENYITFVTCLSFSMFSSLTTIYVMLKNFFNFLQSLQLIIFLLHIDLKLKCPTTEIEETILKP